MGQIKPGTISGGGPGKLMSLIQIGGGIASGNPMMIASGGLGLKSAGTQTQTPDTQGSNAMGRALQQKQQDPGYLIDTGLQHLNNPDVYNQMPYDHYMAAVEPLLRAKYGMGGSDGGGMA
jgi:hypothetical protein